jgi:hypothetical protein
MSCRAVSKKYWCPDPVMKQNGVGSILSEFRWRTLSMPKAASKSTDSRSDRCAVVKKSAA